jgi:gamma-glutamylcyclotransferase (GGCT)/AIG2-like uncharacterized protein YtfP
MDRDQPLHPPAPGRLDLNAPGGRLRVGAARDRVRAGLSRPEGRADGRRAIPATLTTGTLTRLFAYGTLMTGFSRRPLLGAGAVLEARGRIRGTLYDFGEYPGVVLQGTGWVMGELYRLPDMAQRLAELDRTEWYEPGNEPSSLYLRRRVAVLIGDGSTREAWIYVYNGPPGRGAPIASGDWRAHVVERDSLSR